MKVSEGDVAPLLCEYLSRQDVPRLRLVCRSWRASVDKRTTSLTAFAPPPVGRGGTTACPLTYGVHTFSCVLPVSGPRSGGGGGGPKHGPRGPAFYWPPAESAVRSHWVRRLSAGLPNLSSLRLQCSMPGVEDLHHLSRLGHLRHLTLLDFPFGGASGGGAAGGTSSTKNGNLERSVGRCRGLRTLCLHSETASCNVDNLSTLCLLTGLTRLHLQPHAYTRGR